MVVGPSADVVEQPVGTGPIVEGVAGASARAEFVRRQAKREARVRERHPKIGGLLLAMVDDPQSTKAWAVGAVGESKTGAQLEKLVVDGCHVLHDRRIPRSKANIDHIVIAPGGVFIVDAKNYQGKVRIDWSGGLFSPRIFTLRVGGRDCTKLVDGIHKQIGIVGGILGKADSQAAITGVLAFVEADWPLFAANMVVEDVRVESPRSTVKFIREAPVVYNPNEMRAIAELLRGALPPAQ